MFRPRIIVMLLISDNELVKSIRFKDHRYIGDPLNAARIFSEMKADELLLLDISAGAKHTHISPDLISSISNETNMPLSVGGGIKSLSEIEKLVASGAEKVILGTSAFEDPGFLKTAATEFGSSTISVCVDVLRNDSGKYEMLCRNGSVKQLGDVIETCFNFQESGAGEIILQSVNNDGMRSGYDCGLIRSVSEKLTIPVVASGGAGKLTDFPEAILSGSSAVAAGSLFVFHRNGILINYPERDEINELFSR